MTATYIDVQFSTSGTYTTSVAITNSNHTAKQAGFTFASCSHVTYGRTSGKWYFEVHIDALLLGATGLVGIAKTGDNPSLVLGYAGGWSYYSGTGTKINANTETAYGATYTTGDTIGVAVDQDNGTITFYKNNVSQGAITDANLIGNSFVPAVSDGSSDSNPAHYALYTIACGVTATPLLYAPPTGYTPANGAVPTYADKPDQRLLGASSIAVLSASRLAVSCREARCVTTLNRYDGESVAGSSGDLGYFPGAMRPFAASLWLVTENGYLLKVTTADTPVLTLATNIHAASSNWVTSYGSDLVAPGRTGGIVSLDSTPTVLKYLDGVLSRVEFGIASSSGYVYLFDGYGNGVVVSVHTTTGVFTFVNTFIATNCQGILSGFITGTSLVMAVGGLNSVVVFDISTPTAPTVSSRTSYEGTYHVVSVQDNPAYTPITDEPGAFTTLLNWHRASCGHYVSTTESILGHGRSARVVLF